MSTRLVPLGEIVEIDRTGVDPTAIDPSTAYVGLEDIVSDGTVAPSIASVGGLASTKFRFSERHILFGKLRPYLRKVARPDFSGVCSTDIIPILPSDSVDKAYLFHFLRTDRVIDLATSMASGANLPRISPNILRTFGVPLPALDEQRRIASILDQADALRQKRRLALKRLNQLGQAIFIEMFGDPKTNPKGWNSARLGDLCDVASSKRVFVEDFVDSGVPFYRGTEVGKLSSGENIEPDLFITPEHYNRLVSHSGKPELGDLLLPSICHDGRIWKVDSPEPFYFKDGRVLWIKSHQAKIDSEYLRRYLQNKFLFDYTSIASGTTFAELKIINLKNLTILSPPIELQAAFSSRISTIERLRAAQQRAQSAADSLFTSLQLSAFRGELTGASLNEAAA